MKNKLLIICFLLSSIAPLYAQEVYENHKSEIYNYIGRMAQKGFVDFEDHIRPLTKTYLKNYRVSRKRVIVWLCRALIL